MALETARVQLLNPDTGAVVSEVDILTTSSCVAYVNDMPLPLDFRGIKRGTTFREQDKVSVKDVLDKILYPETAPTSMAISASDGEETSEDKVIYIEEAKTVNPFYFSATIQCGKENKISISLERYDISTGTMTSDKVNVNVTPGSIYTYQKKVDKITKDTMFRLSLSDGKNTTVSNTITYKFILPVFVGYCDLNEITVKNNVGATIIDDTKTTTYIDTLIRNNSPLLEKIVTPQKDIDGIVINKATYSQARYYPVILYPNTWDKITSIVDCNRNNITGNFYYNTDVRITPNTDSTTKYQYTIYACKTKYPVQAQEVGAMKYVFTDSINAIVSHDGNGVPTMIGFDVLGYFPLDTRIVVDTLTDLYSLKYPYDGQVSYVKEYKSYYRYDEASGNWKPTNQQIYIIQGDTEPQTSVGKDGDIAINVTNGKIYEKYRNVRWNLSCIFGGGAPSSVDVYKAGKKYAKGNVVYHENKYWKAEQDTSSEPGTDTTWIETKVAMGIEGKPGETATIEIVETVLSSDPNAVAEVENIGDKFHARLKFIIPRGKDGNDGDGYGLIPAMKEDGTLSYDNGAVPYVEKNADGKWELHFLES